MLSNKYSVYRACKASGISRMQNALIERFNGTYRRDILNAYLFEELWQARYLTQEWLEEYNYRRPHESLNNETPKEFLLKCGQLANTQGTVLKSN